MRNEEVAMDVTVFDGTQKDVFEAIEYLVDELNYDIFEVFIDEDEVDESIKYKLREKERTEIKSRHDIRRGTVVLCMTPLGGEPTAIGYGMNKQPYLKCVASAFGMMFGMDSGVMLSVSVCGLEHDSNRSYFNAFKQDFKTDYERTHRNFKDVKLVETEPEDFYAFLEHEMGLTDRKNLVLIDTETKEEVVCTPDVIQAKDDIKPGMILVGNSEREDGSAQMAFMGYHVLDEKLQDFVSEMLDSFGFRTSPDRRPEVIREKYSDSMSAVNYY